MIKDYIVLSVFILMLVMSLSLKIVNVTGGDTSKSSDITVMDSFFNVGFIQEDRFNILNNDFMVTSLLKSPGCNTGSIYATPLFRNAEGVAAIEQNIMKKNDVSYFVYNGQIYQSFPSLQFWIGTNLKKAIGFFKDNVRSHYVLSIVETGTCDFENTLNWQDI